MACAYSVRTPTGRGAPQTTTLTNDDCNGRDEHGMGSTDRVGDHGAGRLWTALDLAPKRRPCGRIAAWEPHPSPADLLPHGTGGNRPRAVDHLRRLRYRSPRMGGCHRARAGGDPRLLDAGDLGPAPAGRAGRVADRPGRGRSRERGHAARAAFPG